MNNYVVKRFLDESNSAVTSACIAHYGGVFGGDGCDLTSAIFFDIISGVSRVHLHKGQHESIRTFKNRLKVLKLELEKFIVFLEEQYDPSDRYTFVQMDSD